MDARKTLIFSDDSTNNWLFKKYYYSGSNSRYWTFQAALNLLNQRSKNPIIVETGCQRMKDDLGAGMSTSIFGEYCHRHGGQLYTVDLIEDHLEVCQNCTTEYKGYIQYVLSDSIKWLKEASVGSVDLLYLDSYDHPYGDLLNIYGGRSDINQAIETINNMGQDEILRLHGDLITPCQQHCLKEFKAAEESGKVTDKTIVLIDDNQLPGGGKSRLVKDYLWKSGWTCVLDLQQSLWIKE